MADTEADSPFAMGMALLSTWSRDQDNGPRAVLIEDLHWADSASRQALCTAASRLSSDRVLLLITSRPDGARDGWERFVVDVDRCTRLILHELNVEQVTELAAAHGVLLSTSEADRLQRHTAGQPLHLQMLLSELSPAQLKTSAEDLPAPRSLASATIATLAELPHDARHLAAAMAIVNQPMALAQIGRIAGIQAPLEPLDRLLATGLVSWSPDEPGSPVSFAHPLFRVAVARDLSPTKRRDLHAAAAAVLSPAAALPHRVAAADGADDELADELDDAVAHLQGQRKAATLVARNLLWASSLTSSTPRSEERLLRAVRAILFGNQIERAVAMRRHVEGCRPSQLRSLVLGLIDWDQGKTSDAELHLRGAQEPEATATQQR